MYLSCWPWCQNMFVACKAYVEPHLLWMRTKDVLVVKSWHYGSSDVLRYTSTYCISSFGVDKCMLTISCNLILGYWISMFNCCSLFRGLFWLTYEQFWLVGLFSNCWILRNQSLNFSMWMQRQGRFCLLVWSVRPAWLICMSSCHEDNIYQLSSLDIIVSEL